MKYNLIQLDKTQIYSFKGCNDQHLKEVLKWLKENDNSWNEIAIKNFKRNSEKLNLKYISRGFGYCWTDKPHTELIIDLFKDAAAEGDLQQQLKKAKAEVARLEKEIEIKVGDWVYCKTNDCVFKYQFGRLKEDLKKITNPQLIKLLEDEI